MVGPKAPKQPPSLELYILLAYMGTDCCRFPPIIAPPLPSTCLRLGYSEDYEGANLSCLLLGMYVCRRMKDNEWDVKSIGRVVPTVCVIHLDDTPLPPQSKQASKLWPANSNKRHRSITLSMHDRLLILAIPALVCLLSNPGYYVACLGLDRAGRLLVHMYLP